MTSAASMSRVTYILLVLFLAVASPMIKGLAKGSAIIASDHAPCSSNTTWLQEATPEAPSVDSAATRRLHAVRTRITRRRRTRTKAPPATLEIPSTPTVVSMSVENTSTSESNAQLAKNAPVVSKGISGSQTTKNVSFPGDVAVSMATSTMAGTGTASAAEPEQPRVQRVFALLPEPGDEAPEDTPPGPHKMLIVTAIQPAPCDAGVGNYVNLLSIKNKEMYAKIHNYGLHWSFNIYDPMLQGPWNKVAVLLNLLQTVDAAQYEWLLWVDYDAIFGDMDVTIPFERYAGKDLIFLGDETKLLEGDAVGGLNSGVMLIRVSDWSQRFFTELASYGEKWWDWSDKMETLKTTLKNFAKPLYEQNAVAYFLMRDARYHDKVFLENGEVFVLHTSFDVVPLMKAALGNNHNPLLVIHWSGCQFCKPQTAQNNFQWCLEEFLKRWTEANEQGSIMLGEGLAVQLKDLMPTFRSRAASAWLERWAW